MNGNGIKEIKGNDLKHLFGPISARLAWPLVLAALSLGLNLHDLAADSFWGDEIFTASYASRPPAEVIRWTAADIHPPLYYLLAGAFARLTTGGSPNQVSDWLWRFPSVIAGVLAMAVTYRLAGRLASSPAPQEQRRAVAAIAALLLCLSPVAIKYGQEARMHALFMFLSALATWLFFQALARPGSRSRWLAFGLATAAHIYTMYFGFLILAVQAGLLLLMLLAPPRPGQSLARLVGFSAAGLLALALYTPWWPVLFSILRQRAAVGAIEGGVGSPLVFIPGVVQALGPAPAAWLFLLLFLAGIYLLARRYWPLAVFAGLWLVVPVLLPIVLGDPRALQFRYAFVLPVYLAVIACALAGLSAFLTRLPIFHVPGSVPGPTRPPASVLVYLTWLLVTLSFIAVLAVYNQTKPGWRGAAAYLEKHAAPADTILIGPLWDEGRFIGYYYRGQAKLLTPAAFVANIDRYAAEMRASNGRVWAVNRFAPVDLPALKNISFSGVVVSEPQLAVYEPEPLTLAAIHLAQQAVEAAYPWAAEAQAQGVLDPDPRTARAAALRALGDTLVAAGRLQEALAAYQTAVDIFPGWVSGFIVLAETQEAVGNMQAAAEAYRQAVNFNLKWHGTEAEQAAALVEAGQWAAAVEHYHQITKGR